MVEWSCAKEILNENHIFLLNGHVHIKEIKSVGTLNSGQMVHIDLAKMLEHEGSISPSSFYEQLPGLLVTCF